MLFDCVSTVQSRSRRIMINIRHGAIVPKHRVLCGMSSNGLVADARNAHDLIIIIDRCGGSGRVARDQREVVDLIWRSQSPHGWAKLEDLGAATVEIGRAA